MVIGVGVGEQMVLTALPIEFARVGNDAPDGAAMAAEPFCERVHDNVGAEFDGAEQIGGGKRRIDDERQTVFVGDLGNRFNIGIIEHGVADGFNEKRACFGRYRFLKILRIFWIDEFYIDSELRENRVELCIGSSIEVVCRYDFVARLCQGYNGIKNCGLPEATATEAAPPSSCATRCSKTSVVGFMRRV